ncbi:hypothetical protein SAMN05421503_1453 [Terribacillus aidingensis]|uniref:Uncharacterized protein n=1 Tax=Terribacillus aidingensis TaxID=586416 RepID=A0A285NKG7_9BACI|nr:HEPN domain-containing protein [Terribacillus aidingensis]SNZ09990.1 hypothetical protein SAMN05421503_1453 [Terribacillus aidingensis]
MKYFYIARLNGLKIEGKLNRGIQVVDNLRISNNKDRIEKKCDDFFKHLVGKLEYDHLFEGSYVYAEGDYEFDKHNDEAKRMDLLNYFLKVSQVVSSCLWLIKDNSISTEQGFLYIYGNEFIKKSVSSNGRTNNFLNATGNRVETLYTLDELKQGLDINQKQFNSKDMARLDNAAAADMVTNKATRLERFNNFLDTARTEIYVPNKISTYCTALETLLSTDNQEIGHKIAERLARLLGKDSTERIEIFNFIKLAYGIRSANVHGDKLPKKFRDLNAQYEVSIKLDNYIRKFFTLVLENEELITLYEGDNKEDLNMYYRELIFT